MTMGTREAPWRRSMWRYPTRFFSAFLVKQFDKDKDGRISKAEAEKVTAIRVTENWEIASVEGIASSPT